MLQLAGPQPLPLQSVGRSSTLAMRIGRLEDVVTSSDLCYNWNKDGLYSLSNMYKEEAPDTDKVRKV